MFYDEMKSSGNSCRSYSSHIYIPIKKSEMKSGAKKSVYKVGVNDNNRKSQQAARKASRYLQEKTGKKRTHA
jgi:hypothetical protein